MSIEQVNLDIMNVNFTINTPSEEKATLLQAVEMLNKKATRLKKAAASSARTKSSSWQPSTSYTTS